MTSADIAPEQNTANPETPPVTRPASPSPEPHPDLPPFTPVPRKFRHDGWTPERQRAFIGALADTGCISRAARYVNMSPEGAYYLRRQAGSESFRRAWEAALDLGVQRLKDELYERALEGQLSPVFVGGKLKGFRRIKSDRLLMFALRMNARDGRGQRYSASYFDPDAARLHAGTGYSDGGERSSRSEAVGQTMTRSRNEATGPLRLTRLAGSREVPVLSRAEKDDMNAAMVEHFDPVAMSLEEVEAMQAQLSAIAARKRAEMDGPADQDADTAFALVQDGEWKTAGELEDLYPVVAEEDREAEFDEDEDRWWEV